MLRSASVVLALRSVAESRLCRFSDVSISLLEPRANAIRFPPLEFRIRPPRLSRVDVVMVINPAVLAVVVTGLELGIPTESPRDARIVLKSPPPVEGLTVGETGGGMETLGG